MSKGQRSFKQGVFTKALKGVVNAGLSIKRVKIDREGNFDIELITGRPDQEPDEMNEWDSVK
jgi:hypothetical protein